MEMLPSRLSLHVMLSYNIINLALFGVQCRTVQSSRTGSKRWVYCALTECLERMRLLLYIYFTPPTNLIFHLKYQSLIWHIPVDVILFAILRKRWPFIPSLRSLQLPPQHNSFHFYALNIVTMSFYDYYFHVDTYRREVSSCPLRLHFWHYWALCYTLDTQY